MIWMTIFFSIAIIHLVWILEEIYGMYSRESFAKKRHEEKRNAEILKTSVIPTKWGER